MSRTSPWAMALAIAVLIVGVGLSIAAAVWFVGLISSADATVVAASMALVTALLVHYFTERAKIAETYRQKKLEIYQSFVEQTLDLARRAAAGTAPENSEALSEEIEDFIWQFKKDIVLYASPSVVNKFNAFQAGTNPDAPGDVLGRVETLYRAMRKDVGLTNFGLPAGGLIQTILREKFPG